MTDKAREKLLKKITFDETPTLLEAMGATKDWEREWMGMPEFVMGNTEPVQKITVSFETAKDVEEFAKLLGQPLTKKTTSIWFPKQGDYTASKNYRYITDES